MRDFRLAFRSLRSQAGFTAITVLTIALGVGANSAIFTVVDSVMLRPLPFADPDRVVVLTEQSPAFQILSVSPLNYIDVCGESRAYEACGAYRSLFVNVSGGLDPERLPAKMISANLLPMLGVSPVAGRAFTAREDTPGGDPVVILSYNLWTTRFGRSEGVLRQRVLLDGVPHAIVGVLPAGFRLFQPADVFIPLGPFVASQPMDRGWHPGILPVARLKPGVTLEEARTEAKAVAARLERAYPDTNAGVTLHVTRARDLLVQNVRTALLLLLAAVGAVLLIACINVAGLLLARALSRRRDLAVRMALGAGGMRIVRLLLAESVLIAFAGGLAGLAIASFAVPGLVQLVGPALPRADAISVDMRVVSFTLLLSTAAGIVFGLIPAIQSTRVDIREALNEDGRTGMGGGARQRRARDVLVVAEVALTVILMIGAALLVRSLTRLQRVESGFEAARVLVADLPLSSTAYSTDEVRTAAVEQLLNRVRGLPDVRATAITTQLPMAGGGAALHFNVQGRPPSGPGQYALANFRVISPDYFAALGIPLRHGRTFTGRDRQGTLPVAIVNETLAREFFGDVNPVGRRFQLGTDPDPDYPWMEIVGVIGDVRQAPGADPKSEMYVPYAQFSDPVLSGIYSTVTLVVKTGGPPGGVAGALRDLVRRFDPNQPVANMRTMDDVVAASVVQPRFRTLLLGLFAALALTLSGIGIYGLLAHGVVQRLNEFGLRMALGASPDAVAGLVLREGLRLTLIGIAYGSAGAAVTVDLMRAALFGVSPWDPVAWLVSLGTLLAVAVLASWVPARRALRTDPIIALRG